jgi:hypothetical protein
MRALAFNWNGELEPEVLVIVTLLTVAVGVGVGAEGLVFLLPVHATTMTSATLEIPDKVTRFIHNLFCVSQSAQRATSPARQ